MATRYINTSEKTRIIADGIALWSRVQDLSAIDGTLLANSVRADWQRWCAVNPQWVEFVEREQFALFDRVNAAF